MDAILYTKKDGVATITLNRPEKLNSFNREMALLMQEKLDDCNLSEEVRCVVITGSGKAFSAGQDLAEVVDPNGPGMKKILSEHYNPIVKKITELTKPVIGAVNGVAAGAGANIALCCDIVIASGSASFIQAFSKIGLIPDSGGTYFLPRLIGRQKALALMMTGDKLTAEQAEKAGLVFKVFPDDSFMSETLKMASTLASMPTRGLYYTKMAVQKSLTSSLDEQLQLEDEFQQKAAATADFEEGVKAFLEKRKPVFSGC